MGASDANVSSTEVPSTLVVDDISQYAYKSWNELFSMSRQEVEDWQLRSARIRFEQMMPKISAMKDQADAAGVTRINTLEDLVPLLFNHTVYKSYPMSVLENNRFDMLTKWLQRVTAIDLSAIDATKCTGIDHWMQTVEATTPLQIFHTSGTTGKLSFIPRTTFELGLWMDIYMASPLGFGSEPSIKLGGKDGIRLPVIYPSLRHGRYMAQRMVKHLSEVLAPTPEQCYTINNGTLSADLMSLSGRIRVAQAKGELSRMKISDSQRVALKRYMEELERRPQEMSEFFATMIDKLRGQRVFVFSQTGYMLQAAQAGLAQGISNVFAADSVGTVGGGGKGVVLPPDWREIIQKFTGISRWITDFAMTELNGVMPGCPHRYYHFPPWIVPFLLDPETGALLPRSGTQTGRLAAFDLLAQNYWGGIISGDKVTMEWDRACPCGRKGVHAHNDIDRYAATVTGDDKITCSATVDNTDAALQKLLAG